MIQATGGDHPPKQENPHGAQSRRVFGESTFDGADDLNYISGELQKVSATIEQKVNLYRAKLWLNHLRRIVGDAP
jgi:hypothetical protein